MMRSTMQDAPLLVSRILEYGSTVHAGSRVVTWRGEQPPERRSFAEVGARCARLAHALRDELGVTEGVRVGTLMWNDAEHLEAYFAVPCMGAVLHTLNLRLPRHQLAWIINHAADHVIVVDSTLLPVLAAVLPDLHTVRHVVVSGGGDRGLLDDALAQCRGAVGGAPRVHDYEDLLAGRPEAYRWPDLDERAAASLCYTSGTTGDPKGVAYSHRSVYLHSMQLGLPDSFGMGWSDLVLPVVPMFHVNAWGVPHAALMTGSSLLMPGPHLKPQPLVDMIEGERPTIAAAVPSIWIGVLAELDAALESGAPRNVSSLRRVVVGGSACPPALMRDFEERHGVRVLHAWGMTETSPLGSVAHPPAGARGDEAWAYRVSQGRIPCSVELRLIGPDGSDLPWDGESVGEVAVRGPWIAGAYYDGVGADGDAELAWPEDKFDRGWLRTGDVGSMTADGYLTVTDRAKDVIKSGGEWISSVELENLLMGHPAVAEAAVVAVPDERWGERPLATVVLADGAAATLAELRDYLAERLPSWQVPERWTLLDAVPKTSVGKFDKKTIRADFAHGRLDVDVVGRG